MDPNPPPDALPSQVFPSLKLSFRLAGSRPVTRYDWMTSLQLQAFTEQDWRTPSASCFCSSVVLLQLRSPLCICSSVGSEQSDPHRRSARWDDGSDASRLSRLFGAPYLHLEDDCKRRLWEEPWATGGWPHSEAEQHQIHLESRKYILYTTLLRRQPLHSAPPLSYRPVEERKRGFRVDPGVGERRGSATPTSRRLGAYEQREAEGESAAETRNTAHVQVETGSQTNRGTAFPLVSLERHYRDAPVGCR
ncbi:hypothetical protein EYF80_047077 [Liparis tanakae]|uniref:Uncharacterized protein n=1 Tax=Liparis tanakae TaxID=230148 RepID=A0A4Z2FNY7_9TELE|nr:hypothetical protein EYF80_047077 [Liparis tanakae]